MASDIDQRRGHLDTDEDVDANAIGGVGESAMETWAHQVGIAANKVQSDLHGWDYVLELPRGHSRQGGLSLDLVPCEVRCFVQVKTVTSVEGRVRISLANWNRMAKDPSPWFVIVVVLNADRTPESAFLVHVDESWVHRVLMRLRELPESATLRDRSLEVFWEDSQKFAELHGRSLRDGIRFHAGVDMNAYASMKRTWIDTVGYQDPRHKLQVSFSASSEDELLQMWAEFAVGLRKELPMTAFRAEEVRFDIPKELASFEGEGGTIELVDPKPHGQARMVLENTDGHISVELACDTYHTSSVIPHLPERFRLVRFVAPFCSAVMRIYRSEDVPAGFMQMSFTWHFTSPEPEAVVRLGELASTARAAILLHESHVSPIRMSILDDDGRGFARSDVRTNAGIDASSLHYWTTVDRAHRISQRFGLAQDVELPASAILQQADALESLVSAFSEPTNGARFGGEIDLAEPLPDQPAAMLVAPYFVAGDRVLGACLALVGQGTWSRMDSGRHRLDVRDASVRIVHEFHLLADAWNPSKLDEFFASARAKLGAEGVSLVIFPDGELPAGSSLGQSATTSEPAPP